MKSITPVVSVILMVLITIVASVSAFFFINSNVSDLQSQGNLDTNPAMDNSRLNLVSITGTKAIVRNDGTSPVTEVVMFVNGELLNYTLTTPILPGELREINYTAQAIGEDLEIKLIYNKGKTSQASSPASKNTENSGFDSDLNLFFSSCVQGSEVVNLEDKRTEWLDTDSHTCGCNINRDTNVVINGDFENESNNWTSINIIEGSGIREVYDGNYSLEIFADYNIGVNVALVAQTINGFVDSIDSFAYFNSSSNGTGYSGILIYYTNEDFGDADTLIFVLNGTGSLISNCNNKTNNFFINCSYNLTADSWQNFNIKGIFNHFIDKFPNSNLSEGVTSLYLLNQAIAPDSIIISNYDNVVARINNEGKYCENNNYHDYAQGVCYQGNCVSTYINGFLSNTTFLSNELPEVIISIENFNDSANCNLNIDSSNYPMDVTSFIANYSLSFPLSKGNYLANVTCDNDIFQSLTINLSSDIIKHSWTLELNSAIEHEMYNTIGEINSSHEGKEILVCLGKENQSINIYSSQGEYINNISVSNDKLFYRGAYQLFEGLAVVDVDNDSINDIVIKDANNIYLFNNNLDRIWNYTYEGYEGGIAIVDINESAGLEILVNGDNSLFVLNSTGGLLWEYDIISSDIIDLISSARSPVVADIVLSNPGLEILTVDPQSALAMLNTNGNEMYLFNLSDITFFVSPSVAELNNLNEGLEIIYITNDSETNMSIYLLNSTLGVIWNYSYYFKNEGVFDSMNSNIPGSIAIGDVTGNGEKEIIVSFVNYSENDPFDINDHILILDNNGSLITDYVTMAHNGFNPILLELDSTNPGLEILSPETNYLKVLNYLGETLYEISTSYASGPTIVADDIDGDTFLELIAFETGGDLIKRYETSALSNNNIWPIYKQNLNQTGYQD
jgi:hypothetical protein